MTAETLSKFYFLFTTWQCCVGVQQRIWRTIIALRFCISKKLKERFRWSLNVLKQGINNFNYFKSFHQNLKKKQNDGCWRADQKAKNGISVIYFWTFFLKDNLWELPRKLKALEVCNSVTGWYSGKCISFTKILEKQRVKKSLANCSVIPTFSLGWWSSASIVRVVHYVTARSSVQFYSELLSK